MRYISGILVCCLIACMTNNKSSDSEATLAQLAEEYVRLALAIGQYDDAFVDAYYGPDSLKPLGDPLPIFPKDELLNGIRVLSEDLSAISAGTADSTESHRASWLVDQLISFDRRVRIFSGEFGSFDEESEDLFGVAAPTFPEEHFQQLIGVLDTLLPGTGAVSDRFQELANRFIIPKDKLDTVFHAAIHECRTRTLEHYTLPADEDFRLEFVNNKSWNGYNWYKGNYQSLIQINTDLDIFIDRAIDVGSHESYPGHHVYNMLLEQNLYRDKGYVEMSVYPLYSPQSLIAEGSANYGIDVVFPGDDKTRFASEVLLPLAGLDTTGISLYFKALAIREKLNFVRNEVGRKLLDNGLTEEEAATWLQNYGLYNAETALKSIAFIKNYRTYVINYNYGLELVREYIESRGGTAANPEKRWELFAELLSRHVRIEELID
jgi:hypothetical protein